MAHLKGVLYRSKDFEIPNGNRKILNFDNQNSKFRKAEIIPIEPGQVMLLRDRALGKCSIRPELHRRRYIFDEGPTALLAKLPSNWVAQKK